MISDFYVKTKRITLNKIKAAPARVSKYDLILFPIVEIPPNSTRRVLF